MPSKEKVLDCRVKSSFGPLEKKPNKNIRATNALVCDGKKEAAVPAAATDPHHFRLNLDYNLERNT